MNRTQIFEFARIWIYSENRETIQRPMDQNSAQRPTHSDARPSPWPQQSGARGPLAEERSVTGWWGGVARSDSEAMAWLRTGGGFGRKRSTAFGPALSGRPRGGHRFMALACAWQRCRSSPTRRGVWHTRWRRGTDAWAPAREKETDKWDPRQNYFRIKNTPERK
jgi:hypothetical protein